MKTKEFELAEIKLEYAHDLYDSAKDDSVWNNMNDSFPKSVEEWENTLRRFLNTPKETGLYKVIVAGGKAVGMVGAKIGEDIHAKTAVIAYWLDSEFWGEGISTHGVSAMCEYVFKNYDVARIEATPFAYNLGSRRVLEKAGFKLEGVLESSVFKNGDLYDSCMYALIKNS